MMVSTMKAMILETVGQPLALVERKLPRPGKGQVLIEVSACAVCRTDLHIIDGDLPHPKLPLVLGHEIVGRVISMGEDVVRFSLGDRIGVPWLSHTCKRCAFCNSGRENLCDTPVFTGYQMDGGYATHTVVYADYCFSIPKEYDDVHAAPLLCAGLIGYRALKAAGKAKRLAIFGFGAAAHIIAQIARHEGRSIFAFTRPDDTDAQKFALSLGCTWAGGSNDKAPEPFDAAIIFAPVGDLVPIALKQLVKGGTLVLGGIHMSKIPSMPYELLWGERIVRSIANLTREDGEDFMKLAARIPLEIRVQPHPLEEANIAIERLREGRLTGAAVLIPKN